MRRCICAIRAARSASWPPVIVAVPLPGPRCRVLASAMSAALQSSSSVVGRCRRTSRQTSSCMPCIVPCIVNRALSSTYFPVGSSGPWQRSQNSVIASVRQVSPLPKRCRNRSMRSSIDRSASTLSSHVCAAPVRRVRRSVASGDGMRRKAM